MKKSLGASTIVYPAPVFIVGTYDQMGRPDAMAVAWGGICCSTPPCIAISVRKATHTYGNLMTQRAFTVNIPSERFIVQADYFGLVSGKETDKFSVTGLTPVKSKIVPAPYIQEFPFILECSVLNIVEIGSHTQFVGEIKDIKIDQHVLTKDGLPDIKAVSPVMYAPKSHAYYGLGKYLGKAFSIGRERYLAE